MDGFQSTISSRDLSCQCGISDCHDQSMMLLHMPCASVGYHFVTVALEFPFSGEPGLGASFDELEFEP